MYNWKCVDDTYTFGIIRNINPPLVGDFYFVLSPHLSKAIKNKQGCHDDSPAYISTLYEAKDYFRE